MLEDIPQPTPLDELTVLIIDNQALLHDVIVSAFRDIGVKRVHSAVNAFHALRLCEQLRFDVFLIAFNVSDDKDGFHLFEELRYLGHMTEDSTVVFLSAETSSDLVNCIVELQPDDFWVKPLDKQRILKRLDYLVKIRQKFHKLFYFLKKRDFSTAIYYADRHLRDLSVSEYHPRL
jgi:DNA-binding NarL/FixJ family response regulator